MSGDVPYARRGILLSPLHGLVEPGHSLERSAAFPLGSLDVVEGVGHAGDEEPPVSQDGSRMRSSGRGSSMVTALRQAFLGGKNSPRSPRRLEPTISSYATPFRSTGEFSREYPCNSVTT